MDSEGTLTEASGGTERPAPPDHPVRAVPYGPPPGTPCALCSNALRGADDLVIQYHRRESDGISEANAGSDDRDDGTPTPESDCRGACPACAEEVAELVAAWTATARPPIHARRSIAVGYRAIAEACSFCDRPVSDDPVAGVEYYRAGTSYEDGLGPHRHYVLCPNCVEVFERFLDDVAAEAAESGPERVE